MDTFFTPEGLLPAAILSLVIGAIGALILRRDFISNLWGSLWALLGSGFGLICGVYVMLSGEAIIYTIGTSLPLFPMMLVNVDSLSAFFVAVISLIAVFTSLYSIGYGQHFFGRYSLGALHFFTNLFICGMLLAVTAGDAIFFLVVWELMVLASFFLVVYEHKEVENIQAGILYFIMSHIGTACILLAFFLIYSATGTFDFSVMKEQSGNIPLVTKNLIFILGLIGFGTKAGMIPFHIWLPSAHPAAPSHVSALMSGVMIKTGIYMIIRFSMDFLGMPELWWGIVILLLGAISALFGVLYALNERDIKKLLAYSSIENIGIILLGIGCAAIFLATGYPGLAAIGLIAGLFHTLNHAVFKALLFLGAGAVVSATHTRNMEEYGGLIKTMPYTGAIFLVGAMAISALPPLNGFFSEWLTFKALFSGIHSGDIIIKAVFIIGASSLAFTGGLAAACFVKAFGSTFLARPRSEHAINAREVSSSLLYGMAGLAILTLLIGITSGKITAVLERVVKSFVLTPGQETGLIAYPGSVAVTGEFSQVSLTALFLCLVLAVGVVAFVTLLVTGKRKVRRDRTWDCGTDLTPRMEITPTAFSRSLIFIFKSILRPTQVFLTQYQNANSRYFQRSHCVRLDKVDPYDIYFYRPISSFVTLIAEFTKKIQSGNLNAYLLYILLTLITLLIVLLSYVSSNTP